MRQSIYRMRQSIYRMRQFIYRMRQFIYRMRQSICTNIYQKQLKNMPKVQPNGIWKKTCTSDESVEKSNLQFSLVWMSNSIWKRLALFRLKFWDHHPKLLNRAVTAKIHALLTKMSENRFFQFSLVWMSNGIWKRLALSKNHFWTHVQKLWHEMHLDFLWSILSYVKFCADFEFDIEQILALRIWLFLIKIISFFLFFL